MKQMTCAQMGGPAECNFMVSGRDPEEIVKNATAHVEQEHPQMAADIKKMSPQETKQLMKDFRPKFEAAESI